MGQEREEKKTSTVRLGGSCLFSVRGFHFTSCTPTLLGPTLTPAHPPPTTHPSTTSPVRANTREETKKHRTGSLETKPFVLLRWYRMNMRVDIRRHSLSLMDGVLESKLHRWDVFFTESACCVCCFLPHTTFLSKFLHLCRCCKQSSTPARRFHLMITSLGCELQ